MWEHRLNCVDCGFDTAILSGGPLRYYFCQTCREVIRLQEPRLVIWPPLCPLCQNDFGPADHLAPTSATCLSCGKASINTTRVAHVLMDFEEPAPSTRQTVHGQVIAKGRFVQLALVNEYYWRARFRGETPPVGAWVEARVSEVGKRTLVCEFLRELTPKLISYKNNWRR